MNGVVIRYTVNLVLLNFEPSTKRRKRQDVDDIVEECIVGGMENIDRNTTVPGNTTSVSLEGLSK